MKDSLFEMLLSLFEQTLTQLKEKNLPSDIVALEPKKQQTTSKGEMKAADSGVEFLKSASTTSLRVFSADEQRRFTKTSYQFLVQLISWGVINEELQELIINRLFFSDSRYVTLQETKWVIRETMAEKLDQEQIAFLELVLYQQEDGLSFH